MFEYKVRFYNEVSEVSLSHGIIGAKSYSKAAKAIVEYFGEETIITMELSELMNPLEEVDLKGFMEESFE